MAGKANKTRATGESVTDFLASVQPDRRRADALVLDALFRRVTGWQPRMWGPSIVGYGEYHYVYESGRQGDFLATGFSPRKAALVVYIMPGYADFGHLLDRLGRRRLGKSCLYVNSLADIDLSVLEELVRAGLDRLETYWTVRPS
ncbi:MAG: DUF1801 domain-containing protein [Oricola sp.]